MKTPKRALATVIAPAIAAIALLSTSAVSSAAVDSGLLAAMEEARTTGIEDIVPVIGVREANKIGAGTIKFTKQNVKYLVQKVLAEQIDAKGTSETVGVDRTENQVDEIGEAVAFVLKNIANNPKFTKLGVQRSFSLAILQAALKGVANTSSDLAATSIYRDAAGSLALTLRNLGTITPINLDKIQKFLNTKAKTIAGSVNVDAIRQGLNEGFDNPFDLGQNDPQVKYEDGTRPELTNVRDPETDQRNG